MRATGTYLGTILEHKREEVALAERSIPLADLRERVAAMPSPRDGVAALSLAHGGTRIIAEVKQASPSRGVLRDGFDPLAYAIEVADAGAAALSVLTDARFFQGSFERLETIRKTVRLPLLCKDFVIAEHQLWRARASGADLVLLIVAALDKGELRDLLAATRSLGMEALVEVHDEAELDAAVGAKVRLIGVNNRDLRTFETHVETSVRLAGAMPPNVVRVSESGLRTREDIQLLESHGYNAFLIGEALVTSEHPGALLRELAGLP